MKPNYDYNKIIATALSKGGDYADIYFEHSIMNEISLRDSEVNSAGNHIDYGVGIRVLKGDQTGYAYTESVELEDILQAATVAAQIANNPNNSLGKSLNIRELKTKNYYPIIEEWENVKISTKMENLQRLNQLIFEADERVEKVLAKISDSTTKIWFINSLGESFYDQRPMASIVVSCVMTHNGITENGSASRSFRMGGEMLTNELIEELAKECINKTSILFGAIQPKGGEMPVIMGAGSSGILLHEAIGHAFEADFNRKNISIFADKMGKKICRKEINIVDDGTLLYNRGSINFDDEGIEGQKTYMVKDGILNSYLHDRISAKYYKTSPTGNGRRESFRHIPLPRMRATYMENGNCTEQELIRDIKHGVYVDNFSNGQVQIGAGDFTFYVKSGYLIENGKLGQPIKDINIIGNGPDALASIIAVANNGIMDNGTWTCGKEQYCPVSCGMPSALIEKLTVGGSN